MIRNRLLLALFSGSLCLALAACGGGSGGTGPAAAPVTSVSGGATVKPGTETGTDSGTGIPYEASVVTLPQSGVVNPGLVAAVRDAAAWNALWSQYAGSSTQAPLQPDFSSKMVIAVIPGGASPCDKYAVAAVRQKSGPARIEVEYSVTPPPADTACIASLAFPALFIVVPRSDLPAVAVQAAALPAGQPVVRSGWRHGFIKCEQDCETSVEITKDGAAFHSYAAAGVQPSGRGLWGKVSAAEWDALASSLNTLPDVMIGCPGCADEGVEWVEVEQGGMKKRLAFNCGTDIPGAPVFQQAVRSIRERLAAGLGLADPCSPGTIAFESIPPAVFTSSIGDKRSVTVRDDQAWNALWKEHVGGRTDVPAPSIDFSQRMVLAVFLGNESISCGSMNIESVHQRSNPDRVEVGYRVVDPGPNVMCIAANINQYAFVTVAASSLPVEFVRLP